MEPFAMKNFFRERSDVKFGKAGGGGVAQR